MKIHFICRGNVLRSLVAEAYMKSLEVKNIDCISSGVSVDLDDPAERKYFAYSIALLERHGISKYAKRVSDQLTQERINGCDVTICVNRRAYEEAKKVVVLPMNTIIWDIVDIGEGARSVNKDIPAIRVIYEEAIYKEISICIDKLIDTIQTLDVNELDI